VANNKPVTPMSYLSPAAVRAISGGSILSIRQSYSLLSSEEKQVLWDTKWNTIIANDKDKLSKEQKEIILEIKEFVDSKSIAGLTTDPSEGEAFVQKNMSRFLEHFTNQQLYLLLECSYFNNDFSIFNANEYLKEIDNRDKSIAITSNGFASSCTCLYSASCFFETLGNTCNDGGCTKVAECGLAGTSNCTGTCS